MNSGKRRGKRGIFVQVLWGKNNVFMNMLFLCNHFTSKCLLRFLVAENLRNIVFHTIFDLGKWTLWTDFRKQIKYSLGLKALVNKWLFWTAFTAWKTGPVCSGTCSINSYNFRLRFETDKKSEAALTDFSVDFHPHFSILLERYQLLNKAVFLL